MDAHRVDLDPDSLVASVTGGASYPANSSHHQGVQDPGPQLRVVGWAPDGVVEAVEAPGARWCVGVQWHPERLPTQHPSRALFRELVSQAARGTLTRCGG
jgi:putative glutamine amidotransferase